MEKNYLIKYKVQKEDDCYLLTGIDLVEATIDEDGNLTIDEELGFVNDLIENPDLEEVYIETVALDEIKDYVEVEEDDEESIKKAFIENILPNHFFIAKEQDGKLYTQQMEMESPLKQLAADYLNVTDEGDEITEQGLEDYLNERFVGYEEQNSKLARILFNNLEINTKEDNETILMVGKDTKLISQILRYAAEYMGLPYKRIGIDRIDPCVQVQTSSIEEEILDTIKDAASVEVAHLAIIAIDGISEINNTSYGSRNIIIDNLRRFIEGETLHYSGDGDDIPFDTSYLTKVFIGSFEGYPHTGNVVGFNKEIRYVDGENIIDRISRMPETNLNLLNSMDNLITYEELSMEDKKRYLLTSKLSILVRKEIEMNEVYQVELDGREEYIDALVETLFIRYLERGTPPSLEEYSREIRSILHFIIKDLKGDEEFDTVVLSEDTVYKGTYQLLTKSKGMLN